MRPQGQGSGTANLFWQSGERGAAEGEHRHMKRYNIRYGHCSMQLHSTRRPAGRLGPRFAVLGGSRRRHQRIIQRRLRVGWPGVHASRGALRVVQAGARAAWHIDVGSPGGVSCLAALEPKRGCRQAGKAGDGAGWASAERLAARSGDSHNGGGGGGDGSAAAVRVEWWQLACSATHPSAHPLEGPLSLAPGTR